MEAKKKGTRKKMDLLAAVEQIVDLAKGSQLSKEFYGKADRCIRYMADKLELTKEQCVLMALFVDNSDDNSIRVSDFARYLDCRTTRIIRCMSDIDELERRELVRCSRSEHRIAYRVPMEVIEAFKRNERYVPKDMSGLSCPELFSELEEIFQRLDDEELTCEAVKQKIQTLMACNQQLQFVQKLKSYELDDDHELLLVFFAHLFVNNGDDHVGEHDFRLLYTKSIWKMVKTRLCEGIHPLQKAKMIEYAHDDGFADRDAFCLTKHTKQELLAELHLPSLSAEGKRGDMVRVEEIVPKRLFYDTGIEAQIDELGQLLSETHYQEIRTRLKEEGFRCGFTCLFYGSPGTGKTETVLQLARRTGRDIMQVNVSEIKSMWVGESEKNIKMLFDTYRQKVKELPIAPILLFNEADAIIGKRREGADRAVEKMENSIQNIILQEMETLDGILIATTNLAQNMDKAFERRFLYKIRFTKPTLEARTSIWRTMIPCLGEADAQLLASKYDFSGGQIENIARHYAIDRILHGADADPLGLLVAHCTNERLEQKEQRKIGF